MTAPTMTEAQLTGAILDALSRSQTGLFWRNNTGELEDKRGRWVKFGLGIGSPDIVGILRLPLTLPVGPESPFTGRFVGLEVKADTGKLTVEQTAWHTVARKHGALIAVVRSVREALDVVGAP